MKKRGIILLGLLLLFFSCGENLLEKPEDLIPKETMINIIRDLTILNSAKATNPSILHDYKIKPTAFVLSKYGVDSLQFVKSDKYYASLPNEYEYLYTEIEKQLESDKEQISEEKRIKDSLNLLKKKAKSPIKKKKANDSLQ